MAMRVSTFGQSSTVLNNALKTQSKLAEKQQQRSSGLISADYGGLKSDASTVVNLEVSISRAKSTISAAETTLNRVQTQYSIFGGINDLMTQMRSVVNSVISSQDTGNVQLAADESLKELASLLNTQYQGRYLFAGGDTGVQPVDLSLYEATDMTTVNTDYYAGDTTIQSVRLSNDITLSYGVTADNSGLEKAMRTLSYLANADPLETSDLEEASDLLIEAQDSVIALQSSMSYKARTLETVIESQGSYVASVEEIITDLTSVDVAEATVQATNYETQLKASYAALGTLSDLSLADYLR